MNPDLALVLGVVIAGFSIPAIVSAFSDSRAPRAAPLVGWLGAALIAGGLATKPRGYPLEQIPDVFIKVTRALLG